MEFVLPGPIRRNFNPNNVIFEDYFERDLVGSQWDDSEVASAYIDNNKLIVIPLSDSWGTLNGVIYTEDLDLIGDFEVEGAFDYVSGGSRDIGVIGIALFDSAFINGTAITMNDSWAASSGCLTIYDITSSEGAISVFGTSAGSRSTSGSVTYKVIREGNIISFYEDGIYRYQYTNETNFTKLKLINYTHPLYAYKTAYWDYIKANYLE